MSRKKELIKKDVSLIRIIDLKLNILEFKECYTFKGNHSVTVDNYNYYCKEDTFYCSGSYALVVNPLFKDDAINMLMKSRFDELIGNIDRLKKGVLLAESKLERFKKEIIKFNS